MTSVANLVITIAADTLRRSAFSCITGSPGIGKTVALNEFKRRYFGKVAIVKLSMPGTSARICMSKMGVEISKTDAGDEPRARFDGGAYEIAHSIFLTLCKRSGVDPKDARRGKWKAEEYDPLIVVFDEAQFMDPAAIDMLRCWNDVEQCYAPHPIAFLLVGNEEGTLRRGTRRCLLSDAMIDRLHHNEVLDYQDMTDDDLMLVAESLAELTPDAMKLLLAELGRSNASRSARTVASVVTYAHNQLSAGPVSEAALSAGFDWLRSTGRH
jgi:hypothetical protein